MVKHKRIYLKSIGAGEQDIVLCDVPTCRHVASEIHHIQEKGMGGRKDADSLDNLIALCSSMGDHVGCHQIAHMNDGRLPKEYLKGLASDRIDAHSRPKTSLF